MAWFMVEKDPKILTSVYETEKGDKRYEGENVLHIAIVKQDLDLVKKLVGMDKDKKLLQGRTTGQFFKVRKNSI